MDEEAFLNAILENPADDAPRLIYADWLDERCSESAVRKAQFLRLLPGLLLAKKGPRRRLLELRLQNAAAGLDSKWLAVVSKLPIEACEKSFEFKCPKQWENLKRTDSVTVRHCEACKESVHYCETLSEAQAHARSGHCVALSILVPRRPDDLNSPLRRFELSEVRMLGRIAPRAVVD